MSTRKPTCKAIYCLKFLYLLNIYDNFTIIIYVGQWSFLIDICKMFKNTPETEMFLKYNLN